MRLLGEIAPCILGSVHVSAQFLQIGMYWIEQELYLLLGDLGVTLGELVELLKERCPARLGNLGRHPLEVLGEFLPGPLLGSRPGQLDIAGVQLLAQALGIRS
ncbi:MAG: hypothetical protein OXI97_10545 [Acidimicrobiaceae bacterium]|nr:hypothetical protein [Acidimicrobiaceae bacterium]